MTPHLHLGVGDLADQEVVTAYVSLQKGQQPLEIIKALKGDKAELLDPDNFPIDVQRRIQALGILPGADQQGSAKPRRDTRE